MVIDEVAVDHSSHLVLEMVHYTIEKTGYKAIICDIIRIGRVGILELWG